MNRRIARETLVLEENDSPDGYSRFRKPTIREIATIQGFPITYQFQGNSLSQKWRRVGDAVPPTVSYRLARAILDDIGGAEKDSVPALSRDVPDIDVNLNERNPSSTGRRKLSLSRTFRHHVPYDDMRKFRVDLETTDEPSEHPLSIIATTDDSIPRFDTSDEGIHHPVGFRVVLYRGYAKGVKSTPISLDTSLDYLRGLVEEQPTLEDSVSDFLSDLNEKLAPEVPDATTLQAIRSRRHERDDPIEFDILEKIASHRQSEGKGIVDRRFPRGRFEPDGDFDLRLSESTKLDDFGDDSIATDRFLQIPNLLDGTNLPIRVLMKLVAANYVAHKLNHCAEWILHNPEDAFEPNGLDESVDWASSGLTCTSDECVEKRFERLASNLQTIETSTGHAD